MSLLTAKSFIFNGISSTDFDVVIVTGVVKHINRKIKDRRLLKEFC